MQSNRHRHFILAACAGLALAAGSFGCAKVESAPGGTTGGVGIGDAGISAPDTGAPSAPETSNTPPPAAPPFVLPVSTCGDGVVQTQNEQCDDKMNTGDYGTCNPDCKLAPHCGDHVVQPDHEECDDGNNTAGDGCSTACTTEILR